MDAIRSSQTMSSATLRPCVEDSRGRDGKDGDFDSDNLYIEGDNLEVLKLLQRAYHGKVKLIYIDPPYNTGHDFVYHDTFSDTIKNYKEQSDLAGQSNADTSGRFHANWCSMMYPRLRLARELLSNDGVIFVSIDDNELDNLKKIMDEIFGENCFAARFMWTKTMTPPALSYKCRKTTEYVLCYEKTENRSKFFGDWLDNGDAPLLNSGNHIKTLTFPAGKIRFPFQAHGIISAGSYESLSVENDICIVDYVNANEVKLTGTFKWQQSTLDDEVKNGTDFVIKTRKMSIRFQRQDNAEKYKTPTNFLPIKLDASIGVGTNESASNEMNALGMGGLFDYTKPLSLIETIVKMRCFVEKDDIIVDFFAGSSSTAAAVMKLNATDGGTRKCISVQLPEVLNANAATDVSSRQRIERAVEFLDDIKRPHFLTEIGKERIRRAGNALIKDGGNVNDRPLSENITDVPDIGFRVFRLDESGIRKPEPGELLVDCVKPDRSDLDIVFEMMLKWGLELTLPVEREELAGYPCYTVAYGELVCCLAPGLTIDALEAIAEIEPRRVFILDSILDDSLKLNAVQIFKRVEERTGREVELRTV
ncbi:MAG: site-specific DNA-methyltransferase [Clostridiales bacterium]|nr:site-specific DNA-methyltransferase [Clostridiales bacterium]